MTQPQTSQEPKPFKIRQAYLFPGGRAPEGKPTHYTLEVIDYSAFVSLQQKVAELEAENKRINELLSDSWSGIVIIHNLLLDFYSEPDVYWDNPDLAFKKSKEFIDKLRPDICKKAINGEEK